MKEIWKHELLGMQMGLLVIGVEESSDIFCYLQAKTRPDSLKVSIPLKARVVLMSLFAGTANLACGGRKSTNIYL